MRWTEALLPIPLLLFPVLEANLRWGELGEGQVAWWCPRRQPVCLAMSAERTDLAGFGGLPVVGPTWRPPSRASRSLWRRRRKTGNARLLCALLRYGTGASLLGRRPIAMTTSVRELLRVAFRNQRARRLGAADLPSSVASTRRKRHMVPFFLPRNFHMPTILLLLIWTVKILNG